MSLLCLVCLVYSWKNKSLLCHTLPALVLFIVFALYALAGPINTFRTVDKLRIEDVVGDAKEHDEECQNGEDKNTEDK